MILVSMFLSKYSLNFSSEDFSNNNIESGMSSDINYDESGNNVHEENNNIQLDDYYENKEDKKEENKMGVLEVKSESFEEMVLKSDKTVLIDFYADWCGPCKVMAPIVEKIANENQEIMVVKVNIDNETDIAVKYGIMSIPTFVVIKNGEEVNRVVGAVDKSELENIIK